MTLEEFLDAKDRWGLKSKWLKEPEWEQLFVRFGPVAVIREDHSYIMVNHSIQLANFAAVKPRTGAFTRLVQRIESKAPDLPIFIENLTDSKFADKLPELDFELVYTCTPEMIPFMQSWCFLKGYAPCNGPP